MSARSGNRSADVAGQADRADLIARRAYERWQARGCPQGDDLRDWLDAEMEITAAPPSKAQARPGETSRSRSRT